MFKGMAAILSALVAVPVFACPFLTGSYTCLNENDSEQTLVISQSEADGATHYIINGSELVIDNQSHAITGDPTFRNASMNAWCDSDMIDYEITGQYFDGDTEIGSLSIVNVIKISGDQVTETADGQMRNDRGVFPVSASITCTRK